MGKAKIATTPATTIEKRVDFLFYYTFRSKQIQKLYKFSI